MVKLYPITKDNVNIVSLKGNKIAVVQVELYYKKGGTTNSFLSDLSVFLNKNKDANIVVFSENGLYGYKKDKSLAEQLLNNIKKNNLHQSHAFLFNFYGFRSINNIVTLYVFRREEILNQKEVLIPFIEKRGFLNKIEDLSSDFFTVENLAKKTISFNGLNIKTGICYDALFPGAYNKGNAISIIQSDYHQLNKGYGYERLIILGSILSKFSKGINDRLFINVQNHGGTIVISDKWNIDIDLFYKSKNEPFLLVDTTRY